jgi:hypothetical protein
MSKITLPERGQPLDVAYIYQMGKAINEISDQVSSATYNYTTVKTSAGDVNIKTSETRMIGSYVNVVNNGAVTSGSTKPFTYNFPSDFKYTPIVTATLVNVGKTGVTESATVILTDVTRSGVSGLIRFNSSGTATVNVNIIVIGIPN